MGTFPDNLIDGDKETSITTGGNKDQWWTTGDRDYGQSLIIDLGESYSRFCLRYQTRTSTQSLTPDFYGTVTQEGRAVRTRSVWASVPTAATGRSSAKRSCRRR